MDKTIQERHNENYRRLESAEFSNWFENIYGPDIDKDANNNYWTLRIYTLIGWLAKKDSTAYNRGYTDALCDAKTELDILNKY